MQGRDLRTEAEKIHVFVIYSETCRCAKRLTTNWIQLEPYVIKRNSSDKMPGGLLSPFVDDMAVTCCQFCKTHGESYVDYEFNGEGGPAMQSKKDIFKG